MKKLKYLLIFILSLGIFNSCLIDDETDLDLNADGYNLIGFEDASMTVAGITDGSEYTFKLEVKLIGPTSMGVTNDITLTFGAHKSSTAIEGTHFRIDNSTVTLAASDNHLALVEFTMLTDGLVAPLDEVPVLVLEVVSASGDPTVVINGKTMTVSLNYACFSNLAGTYNATMIRDGGTPVNYVDEITETGVGEYRTTEVGHWIGGLGVGTPGFTFYDVCNVITVPGQDLVDYYGNLVEGTQLGSVDPGTGIIHIVYSISSSGWSSVYDCTYVPE